MVSTVSLALVPTGAVVYAANTTANTTANATSSNSSSTTSADSGAVALNLNWKSGVLMGALAVIPALLG